MFRTLTRRFASHSSAPTVVYSPAVAHLLRQHHIVDATAAGILGTGPKGRILKGDVLAWLNQGPSAAKTMASSPVNAVLPTTLPQYTSQPLVMPARMRLSVDVDGADAMVEMTFCDLASAAVLKSCTEMTQVVPNDALFDGKDGQAFSRRFELVGEDGAFLGHLKLKCKPLKAKRSLERTQGPQELVASMDLDKMLHELIALDATAGPVTSLVSKDAFSDLTLSVASTTPKTAATTVPQEDTLDELLSAMTLSSSPPQPPVDMALQLTLSSSNANAKTLLDAWTKRMEDQFKHPAHLLLL